MAAAQNSETARLLARFLLVFEFSQQFGPTPLLRGEPEIWPLHSGSPRTAGFMAGLRGALPVVLGAAVFGAAAFGTVEPARPAPGVAVPGVAAELGAPLSAANGVATAPARNPVVSSATINLRFMSCSKLIDRPA
jgi:hypothetical protein